MNETKVCGACSRELDTRFFARNVAKPDGLQTRCRECVKEYNAEYYKQTKHVHNPKRAARRLEIRSILRRQLIQYLKTHPCVDCGESDIVVLDFDHLRDKTSDISSLLRSGAAWSTIEKEIDKCDVVCANDHRRRTAKRARWARLMPS